MLRKSTKWLAAISTYKHIMSALHYSHPKSRQGLFWLIRLNLKGSDDILTVESIVSDQSRRKHFFSNKQVPHASFWVLSLPAWPQGNHSGLLEERKHPQLSLEKAGSQSVESPLQWYAARNKKSKSDYKDVWQVFWLRLNWIQTETLQC